MPLIFCDGLGSGDDRSKELERMLQDFYTEHKERLLAWFGSVTVGQTFLGKNEIDLTQLAWRQFGDAVANHSQDYLRKDGESEPAHHQRLIELLLTTTKEVIKQYGPRSSDERPPPSPSPENSLPGEDQATLQVLRDVFVTDPHEFHRCVLRWADGQENEIREIARIVVEKGMLDHRHVHKQICEELNRRLGGGFEPKQVKRLCRQLRLRSRKYEGLRLFFHHL